MINLVSSSRYKFNRKNIRSKTQSLLDETGIYASMTLNLVFVGRNKMKRIATEYKKETAALPVLSFSYKDERFEQEKLLGEIFICYPQAVLLAAERNRKVEETLVSLIKHGIENLIK